MSSRVLAGLATAVLAATVAGAADGTAVASTHSPEQGAATKDFASRLHTAPKAAAAPRAAVAGDVNTPTFAMGAVDYDGSLFVYAPDGKGGLQARKKVFDGADVQAYKYLTTASEVDNNKDGRSDGLYTWWPDGNMDFTSTLSGSAQTITVGSGWEIYDMVLSPGNLAGGKESDIIARDSDGVLWLYLAYPDGRVTPRIRIGSGWDAYTQIAGQGDLTGDGKADIVARDKSGVLWLYKGTGDYRAPFEPRQRIGAGWNMFDKLVSIGDMDGDGKADLLARTPSGDLYFYKGTGNASAPYAPAVKIGWGYDTYRLLLP
ncbi:VCBS repeat-containing protein [Kitasatospora sp. GP82]|uniref:FG-GAP repeat domain-containing protein n=1 Tax=Kitasatospora sp. GP82 TaxID=3035089 RepID=UPI002474911A|nr:VCBS repeat-containing protein [Kitasatospora sp. GP82]